VTLLRLTALVVAGFLLAPVGTRAADEPLKGFDDYVTKALKDWDVPGCAIAIVKDGKVILAKGYGIRKLGESDPVDEKTIFAIASCTKAFTAAALALLVEEGEISWDDPVTKHLPKFQLHDPHTTREITIRDLLCHRCGLARHDLLWYGYPRERDEIIRRIRFAEPTWGFRSQFGYQNIMFLAAGQIVPAVTGQSWDDFITDRFFKPLGMSQSNTSTLHLEKFSDVASPHELSEGKVLTVPWRNIDNAGPAGSINSNVAEMAEWVRLQLNEGKLPSGKHLLSAKSIKEMQSPQMAIRTDGMGFEGIIWAKRNVGAKFLTYGLGWMQRDFHGRTLVWHGGSIDGMRSQVALIPEEKLGMVILSNRGNQMLPEALVYRICDLYFGGAPKDWSADLLKVQKEIDALRKLNEMKDMLFRAKDTKPSLPLEKYAGTYTSELYGDVKVAFDNAKLALSYGEGYVGELEHWHFDTFRATWKNPREPKALVTFVLNAQGAVGELRWDDVIAKRPSLLEPKKKPE
jgi:CubicO group peptidase (beta-lactamase class C family)